MKPHLARTWVGAIGRDGSLLQEMPNSLLDRAYDGELLTVSPFGTITAIRQLAFRRMYIEKRVWEFVWDLEQRSPLSLCD